MGFRNPTVTTAKTMNLFLVIVLISTTVIAGDVSTDTSPKNKDSGGIYPHQKTLKFGPGFLFGASSSAIQVEGAWNEDGKGPSGWDDYIHTVPSVVTDGTTSDVACDSYHLYNEDLELLKSIGMNTYRFSLSWPRILPTGTTNNINQKAVDYYNDVINQALSKNITPVVTIYHWDLPVALSKMGGWTNTIMVYYFVEYAEFVIRTFGDRVKYWITLNEPHMECMSGYAGYSMAPDVNDSAVAPYLCGHNKLLAHAQVYHLYQTMPDYIKDGKVGISFDIITYLPRNEYDLNDRLAAEIATEFTLGWFANPIFGSGGYPEAMRVIVDTKSQLEGYRQSRLPEFTTTETKFLRGAADFFGFNQYNGFLASFINHCPDWPFNLVLPDAGVSTCPSPAWEQTASPFLQVTPGSMKTSLEYVRDRYNNPLVYITENGYAGYPDENNTYNPARENFFKGALSDVLESIDNGCNVQGYMVWSLLDDMEWSLGYTVKFGIVHVDFNDPKRKRTMKSIGKYLENVYQNGLTVDVSSRLIL